MKRTLLLAACAAALAAQPPPPRPRSRARRAGRRPPAAAGAPGAADWRTPDPNDVLVIDTNKGRIIVEMVAGGRARSTSRRSARWRTRTSTTACGSSG